MALIGNPRTDLWLFYRQLSTTALLDENKIVAVITIPVLQIRNQFEVYRVYSLPLPTENLQTDNADAPDMTASFKLEARGLMKDKGRTRYALLTEAEIDKCSDLSVKCCNVESPLFPVNLAKICIVNLFLKNQEASQKYCQSIVTLNTRLPFGLPLFNSVWAIALQDELRLSFVCNESVSKTETVTGPLSILEVPPSCVASNDYMVLSSLYTIKREYKISDTELDLLHHLQFNIWSPFMQNFSNFTTIPLPEPRVLARNFKTCVRDSLLGANWRPRMKNMLTGYEVSEYDESSRAPDRGSFCVFDAKKMGKNSSSLKPMRHENGH